MDFYRKAKIVYLAGEAFRWQIIAMHNIQKYMEIISKKSTTLYKHTVNWVGDGKIRTAALLERIALIAKLATSTDCDHDERERVAIWIAEMAVTASDRCRSCFVPRRSCTGYIQRARRSGNASNSDTLRVIDWKDTPAVKATVARISENTPRVNKAQRSFAPTKGRDVATSARLTA